MDLLLEDEEKFCFGNTDSSVYFLCNLDAGAPHCGDLIDGDFDIFLGDLEDLFEGDLDDLFKGDLEDLLKGDLEDPLKGDLEDLSKGDLEDFFKGDLDEPLCIPSLEIFNGEFDNLPNKGLDDLGGVLIDL